MPCAKELAWRVSMLAALGQQVSGRPRVEQPVVGLSVRRCITAMVA